MLRHCVNAFNDLYEMPISASSTHSSSSSFVHLNYLNKFPQMLQFHFVKVWPALAVANESIVSIAQELKVTRLVCTRHLSNYVYSSWQGTTSGIRIRDWPESHPQKPVALPWPKRGNKTISRGRGRDGTGGADGPRWLPVAAASLVSVSFTFPCQKRQRESERAGRAREFLPIKCGKNRTRRSSFFLLFFFLALCNTE